MRVILTCLALVSVCSAEIITSDRRTTWEGNVGIPGGIPDSSAMTVFTTVAAGASLATVQAAIDACPSGQVVQLSAGAYSFADFLNIDRSNCVLRGMGQDVTTITFTANGGELRIRGVPFSAASETALSVDANLSANAVEGTTTLTLASVPSWVTAGELIGIDQLDDASIVNGAGEGSEPGNSYRGLVGNGDRGIGQVNRVISKTATTITLDTPLVWTFTTALTAQIFQPFYDPSTQHSAKNSGVEDMTITSTQTGASNMIRFEDTDTCWIKNVEIDNQSGAYAVWVVFSYRLQFEQLYIHDSHQYGGGRGYGVALWYNSTRCLIEDSIFLRLHAAMGCAFGPAGNVFAYNYELEGMSDAGQNPSMSTHGVHPVKNLWEGNYCEDKLLADWTHGSASHNTVFRNRVTGENGFNDSRVCISVEYYNRYWNVVGNILGVQDFQNKYVQDSSSPIQGTNGSIIKIGGEININSDFTPSDVNSYTTGSFVLLHGNYDYVNDAQVWESTIADHVIPDSLYLTAKPAFFGALDWPPFDPANPSAADYTDIPAGNRTIDRSSPTDSIGVATTINASTLHIGNLDSPPSTTQNFDGYTAGVGLATLPGWAVKLGDFITFTGGYVTGNTSDPNNDLSIAAYEPSGFHTAFNHQVEVTIFGASNSSQTGQGAAIAIQPSGSCYLAYVESNGSLVFAYVDPTGTGSDAITQSIAVGGFTSGIKVRLTVGGAGESRVCSCDYDTGAGWVAMTGGTNKDFGSGKRLDGGKGGICGKAALQIHYLTSLTITNL